MASFSLTITKSGLHTLTDAQLGATLIPTKIVIGSGYMPEGKTPADMTEVVTVVKELPISSFRRGEDGTAIFGCSYSNKDITEPFYFRELALYCKAEYRDESGNVTQEVAECAYAYGNAGDQGEYMPAYDASSLVERQINIVVYIGSEATVTVQEESGIYLQKSTFDEFKAAVDTTFENVATYLSYKSNKGHKHDHELIAPLSIDIRPNSGEGHGGFIDFHYDGQTEDDYTTRLQETAPGVLSIDNYKVMTGANIIVVNNIAPIFTNGATYYLHPAIRADSICMVQRNAVAGGEAIPFASRCTAGQVDIATNAEITGAMNINILIINP